MEPTGGSRCAQIVFVSQWRLPPVAHAWRSEVSFDAAGNTLINGKPFFPIGIFNYSPDTAALDDIREHGFNTIIATTEHHKPEHLEPLFGYGPTNTCPAVSICWTIYYDDDRWRRPVTGPEHPWGAIWR